MCSTHYYLLVSIEKNLNNCAVANYFLMRNNIYSFSKYDKQSNYYAKGLKICVVSNLGAIASLGAPSDLVTSEVTARGFRVSWTHAPGKVEKYRVVYYPSRGGQPEEVIGRKAAQKFLMQQGQLTRQEIRGALLNAP